MAEVIEYTERVPTTDEVSRDLDAMVARSNNLPPSKTIWSFGYNAEDTITIYGALRTYLKVLTQQPEEDLETIARVTRLMIDIKPQAFEASQEIASRTTSS